MCRLLAVVTRSSEPIRDALGGDLHAFRCLSREHSDGWGMSVHGVDGIATTRGLDAAFASEAFERASGVVGRAAIIHLRRATGDLAVNLQNSHPFTQAGMAFAHNGYYLPFDAIRHLVPPHLAGLASGTTDSELYFLRILARIEAGDRIESAILGAAADIKREAREFASLNCLLLTADGLYAYADENPDADIRIENGDDFFRLMYREEQDRIVISSTGYEQPAGRWKQVPFGSVLRIGLASMSVAMVDRDERIPRHACR